MSTSIDNLGLVVNIIDSFRIHTKDIVDRYDREILGTFKPNGAQLLEDFIKNNFSSSKFAGKLDACYSLDFVKVYVNLFEQELENKVSEICFLSNFINALFWLFMVFIFALLLIMDMFVANIYLFVRDLFNYNRIIYSTLILF